MHELGHIKGRNQYSNSQIVRERWAGNGRGVMQFCGRRALGRYAVASVRWYQQRWIQ